jgi:hypothetical protein
MKLGKRPLRKSPRKEGPRKNQQHFVTEKKEQHFRSLKKALPKINSTRLTLVPIPHVGRTEDLAGTVLKTHCLLAAKQGFEFKVS